MNELEVPQASVDALYRQDHPRPSDEDYIRPIAAPVVAAELYRLAGYLVDRNDSTKLRRRAAELDGGAS